MVQSGHNGLVSLCHSLVKMPHWSELFLYPPHWSKPLLPIQICQCQIYLPGWLPCNTAALPHFGIWHLASCLSQFHPWTDASCLSPLALLLSLTLTFYCLLSPWPDQTCITCSQYISALLWFLWTTAFGDKLNEADCMPKHMSACIYEWVQAQTKESTCKCTSCILLAPMLMLAQLVVAQEIFWTVITMLMFPNRSCV